MKEETVGSSEQLSCRVEVAESLWARTAGLLGRRTLRADGGLWIRPCNSVHTFFLRFSIDVVYLAADYTVVKTCSRLKPFRFSMGGRKANSVLELPAGSIDRCRVAVSQKLEVTPAVHQECAGLIKARVNQGEMRSASRPQRVFRRRKQEGY